MERFMKNGIAALLVIFLATGCATQRYGRAVPVGEAEKSALTCESIAIEIAKNDAFLEDIRRQRSQTSGAHVLGALGDFGIGNTLEGDAAEQSGFERKTQLAALKTSKGC